MKKIIAAALSVSIVISLSSCKKEEDKNILNTALERFTYENFELTNYVTSIFGIDNNNIIYVLSDYTNEKNNIELYSENGSVTDTISIDLSEINDGTEDMSEIKIDPIGIDIYEGKIFILCNISNTFKVYVYDINSKSLTDAYTAEDFANVEKNEANADGIYLIGVPNGGKYVSEKFTDENGNDILFECGQKIIECITSNREFKNVETEYPVAFTARKDGGIIIYAFDKTGGYYFSELKNNSLGKKSYNNSYGLLSDIDLFGNENDIIVCGGNNHKLCAGAAEAGSGVSDVLENVSVYLPEDVKCNSNYIFFKSGDYLI